MLSQPFVENIGTKVRKFERPWTVSLANDSVNTVDSFALIDVMVGNIIAPVMAIVYGNWTNCDIVLSQSWLLRIRTAQDWGSKSLVVHGLLDYGTRILWRIR